MTEHKRPLETYVIRQKYSRWYWVTHPRKRIKMKNWVWGIIDRSEQNTKRIVGHGSAWNRSKASENLSKRYSQIIRERKFRN